MADSLCLPINQLEPGLGGTVHSENSGLLLHVVLVANLKRHFQNLLSDVKHY